MCFGYLGSVSVSMEKKYLQHVTHELYMHKPMMTPYLQLWNEICGEAHFISQEN